MPRPSTTSSSKNIERHQLESQCDLEAPRLTEDGELSDSDITDFPREAHDNHSQIIGLPTFPVGKTVEPDACSKDNTTRLQCSFFLGLLFGVFILSLWTRSICWASESLLLWYSLSYTTFGYCFKLLMMLKISFSCLIYIAAYNLQLRYEQQQQYHGEEDSDHDVGINDPTTSSVASPFLFSDSEGRRRLCTCNFMLGLLFGSCLTSILVDVIGIWNSDFICGVYHIV